jgi:hypothetical protein
MSLGLFEILSLGALDVLYSAYLQNKVCSTDIRLYHSIPAESSLEGFLY